MIPKSVDQFINDSLGFDFTEEESEVTSQMIHDVIVAEFYDPEIL